ncbi:YfiR/HmsC family protein [uncultured Dokdonia sp.]|uniref:YfiR/HmsC family protein n=1 Tax=uncultured Dokdonia sp. TaxID=575653 RepID=UPI002605245B|nr:YfiR/HmsC family protein [uncultured Dokdonia sp.]
MHSQSTTDEVERQQRAIFIFNFAQQIIWPSESQKNAFTIGVMGADPTIVNVSQIAQKRFVYGKPIQVKRINRISEIDDVHIVYVHKKYNFNVGSILKAIRGKRILLISEGYDYNASMINMIRAEGTYKYEINKKLISRANLRMTSSLEEFAISSIDKWQELYRNAEEKLSAVTEENQQQKEIIEQQQEEIGNQQEAIVTQLKELETKEEVILEKDYSIQNLSLDSELKNIALKEKIALEKELEQNIQKQIKQLKAQDEKIKQSDEQIKQQQEFLEYQNADILEKEAILKKNTTTILNQKRANLFLILLSVFLVLASLWIFLSRRKSKKLNRLLKKQHTAIEKQSEQLASKNKELEQFAYIASHDLQEPLNTVSSFIELLEVEYKETFDSDGKEILNFIKEGSVRMKKLINALLEYSRLGRDSNFKEVDCTIILQELKADLKTVIEENGVLIETKNLPLVKGNEIELRLLFQNLISNGIKFRLPETNPHISINCKPLEKVVNDEVQKYWQFSVKDNGIGIPKKYQDRIFGIFQRLHTREEYKGSGIGLAHCEKIVKSHGGTIWLESQEGQGTTFYFTIEA